MYKQRSEKMAINSLDGIAASGRARPAKKPELEDEYYLGIGPPPPEPKPAAQPKVVSLEIKLPKLPRMPHIHLPRLTRRQLVVLGASVLSLAIVSTATIVGLNHFKKKPATTGVGTAIRTDFKPLVPVDNLNIAKVQGATSTYDAQHHVLSYTDSIGGALVTISQQPIPSSFKTDASALGKLADNLGPNKQTLETDKGTAYLLANPKTGEETILLTSDSLLIFIRAAKSLDQTALTEYIGRLITV